MNRPRLIVFVLAVVLVAGVIVYLCIPQEPRYQGRKLSEWLGDFKYHPYGRNFIPVGPSQAPDAVKQIGTNAIPWLLKWALAKDSKATMKIKSWINSLPFLHLEIESANERCWDAAHGLKLLGDKADAARTVLAQWTCDKDPRRRIRGYFYLMYLESHRTMFVDFSDPLQYRLESDPDEIVGVWRSYRFEHRNFPDVYEIFPDLTPIKSNPAPANQSAAK